MSTKPSEKMHRPLQKIYLNRTNFKNVADQVWFLVLERNLGQHLADFESESEPSCCHTYTRAAQYIGWLAKDVERRGFRSWNTGGSTTWGSVPSWQQAEACLLWATWEIKQFKSLFPVSVAACRVLDEALAAHSTVSVIWNGPSPFATSIHTHGRTDNPLSLLQKSSVTWRLVTDYLCTSPLFHRQPRYDFVLVNAPTPFFGQLLCVFSCCVNKTDYPIALIQLYEVLGPHSRPIQDKQLGLLHVCRKDSKTTEFISLQSVIRGALVVSAESGTFHDCFIVDVVDEDMFLRVKHLFPGYTATPDPIFWLIWIIIIA